MAEEIQEAVQIIRVAYDGIDIAMKIGSGTIGQIKKAVDLMVAVLDREKLAGKTNMRNLLQKGGDLQVLQFALEDIKQVEKLVKKYGILYCELPDINKKDGMSEILFHTEAVPRVNMPLQKLKTGRLATIDDYLKNGDEKELDKFLSVLKDQKRGNAEPHTETPEMPDRPDGQTDKLFEEAGLYAVEKGNTSVEDIREKFGINDAQAEDVLEKLEKTEVLKKTGNGQYQPAISKEEFADRISRYKELSGRIHTVSQAQDRNLLDITVTKQLITEENDHAVKTRIPGTWGENARYLWIDKKDIVEIHSGKTMLTYLDKDKEYKLYSADNRTVGTMNGGKIYEDHYDRVEAEVRKRQAEAESRKRHAQAKKQYADAERGAAELTRKAAASLGRMPK
ncbi:MAG: PcfB family protein [Lachnospiraceae bacterium]|nr:PcfB family protein [Lachnospiraceae bacterium]